MSAVYKHVTSRELPQKNIASAAISAYYPDFTPARVRALACQVLCMISGYHLGCVTRGSATTSPILPEDIEENLPPLAGYALPEGSGMTDVRVCDHKARSLRVAVWLHHLE